MANQPELRADHTSLAGSFSSESDQNPGHEAPAVEQTVSRITPHRESAWLSPDVEVTGFFHHPLLITSEPALVQLHVSDVTHQRWQRFGLTPAAPFPFSRTLPLQI